MTIAVFDSYAGKGVAQEALRQFLEQNALWPVSAVVKRGNPNRDAIIAVLTKSGFEDHGGCPDTTFLFTR